MARILVVDDEDSLRRLLKAVLERAGHEVTTASDGVEAVRLVDAGPFDLVVTDLIMPEMEGIATIQQLRRLAPDMKIIAMSGGGRGSAGDYLDMAKQLGASMTLMKPFTPEGLVEAVAQTLKK